MNLPAEWSPPEVKRVFGTNKGKQLVSDLFGQSVCHQLANFWLERKLSENPVASSQAVSVRCHYISIISAGKVFA